MQSKQLIPLMPFKQWIFHDEENKRLICVSIIAIIILFSWLKYNYPYPNFMPPDSYNYLEAAKNNNFINIWPIGYSKFLRLISVFSQSDIVLIIIQYLLLMASVLYLLFTIRYLLSIGKWPFRIILAGSIFNPLLPHIANFVSSDCLFTTLSIIWFTQLLWIIYQPNKKLPLAHTAILLFAFMVRFTAIWYPLTSITVIIISNMSLKPKWASICFVTITLLVFIGFTEFEYKIKTGTIQYAAFGGWQMASNALYGYAYATPDDAKIVPRKFKALQTLVNHHMDSVRSLTLRPDQPIGVYYLWDFKSPLRVYMNNIWHNDKKTSFFNQWASMSPLYASYGRWLTIKHPGAYIKYYAWPNLVRYYWPPANFMGIYNMGNNKVDSIVTTWFDWENNLLPTRTKDKNIRITGVYSNLLAILNPMFLLSSAVFIGIGGLKKSNKISKKIIISVLLIWFFNAIFSILSAPIELRYQLFPSIMTFPFTVLIISWIIYSLQSTSTSNQSQKMQSSNTALSFTDS